MSQERLPGLDWDAPGRESWLPGTWISGTVPVYTVRLERTGSLEVREYGAIQSPQNVAELVRRHIGDADREYLVAVLLDTKNAPIGITTVSVGILDSSLVHPREVFKPAILASAAAVILAHNHPSGDPTPSHEDRRVTERLAEAGKLLGIELVDHVIVGDTRWVSLKERGML